MVETEPIFLLESHRSHAPFDRGFRDAVGSPDFTELALPDPTSRPHHFGVVVNPYDLDAGAFYTVMYKRPYRDDYPRLKGRDWGMRPGDDFLHVVGVLTDEVPEAVPALICCDGTLLLEVAAGPISAGDFRTARWSRDVKALQSRLHSPCCSGVEESFRNGTESLCTIVPTDSVRIIGDHD